MKAERERLKQSDHARELPLRDHVEEKTPKAYTCKHRDRPFLSSLITHTRDTG